MERTHRRSPRSEPDRIYKYFLEFRKRQPGELNLKTKPEFRATVGLFILAKRDEFWVKLIPTFHAWQDDIKKQLEERTYVKRRRKSRPDNLLNILGMLYWNYAAWIILRGEYKGMKKRLRDNDIEKRLKACYGYLSQVKKEYWFMDVQRHDLNPTFRIHPSSDTPLELAYLDSAESLGLDSDSLRIMLSPKRLRESPPASLIAVSMDSKQLRSRLQRIPPRRRTAKDKALIRIIKAEV